VPPRYRTLSFCFFCQSEYSEESGVPCSLLPIDTSLKTRHNEGVPQAIFFDMDSTIITWENSPVKAWGYICQSYAPEVAGLQPDVLQKAIRSVADWFWSAPERHQSGRLDLNQTRRDIVRMALGRLNIDNPAFADKVADAYSTDREETAEVMPEALSALEDLRRRDIRLAMITNGEADLQRAKIVRFNLAPFFDNILIEGEFGCGKPDERVFHHTLKKLQVKPSAAWMVGDDLDYDIAPCRALGIYSLWVNPRRDSSPPADGIKPDKVIHSISEIPGLL
jgi:putative hydrolase of the HAD superfamily